MVAPALVPGSAEEDDWPEPDFGVLRPDRWSAPHLPLALFGPAWADWITTAAAAAACPPDYVAAPLLAAASALIGHARWAEATPGWAEPPHLWLCAVGDSGNGKSPGADCLMRDVLPEIECRMLADFPDRWREWQFHAAFAKTAKEQWHRELRAQARDKTATPMPPVAVGLAEPRAPRLRQHDVTIEKVAELLGTAAPKGLLIVRDELLGWIEGMNIYHGGGRSFWIEAYGGRPYRVERKAQPEPIVVPRLAVAVYGGTQPGKLARLRQDGDDGLLSRILWLWPEPIPFRLGYQAPGADWAMRALDRLRELDLQPGDPPHPIMVPLTAEGRDRIEIFARTMEGLQKGACGLLRGAYGKARGQALRLSLVLELLWWCADAGTSAPPTRISPRAFQAAAQLMDGYFIPMALRVYGDGVTTEKNRNVAALARWVLGAHPSELHVRKLLRHVRLPGLSDAGAIHEAAQMLVEAGWLKPPARNRQFGPRLPMAYPVNPGLWRIGLRDF